MKIKKYEKGFALVVTMLIMLVFALLGMSLVGMSMHDTKTVVNQKLSDEAFYYADGAIERAISLVKSKTITYPHQINDVSINRGTYNLNIIQQSDRVFLADSIGYSKKGISRDVIAKFYIRHAKVFDYTLAANNNLDVASHALVSSHPSSGSGNLYANGDITVGGACTVDGSVDATGSISTVGSGLIVGDQSSGVQPLTFPPVDHVAYKLQAQSGWSYVGDQTYNDGNSHILADTYIDGNLYVNNITHLELTGVLYVTGSIIISGGSSIGGGYPIVAEGDIEFMGNSSSEAPLVVSVYGNINVTGNSSQRGFIYAQKGTASVSGNGDVYGAVIGQNVSLSGNGKIYRLDGYNFELPYDSTSRVDILSWEEK